MLTAQPSAAVSGAALLPESTDAIVPAPAQAPSKHAAYRFTLYAYHGHVYASNVRGKLIDLGTLAQDDAGAWAYALDGDECPGESGFASAEEALAGVARCVSFLYLDGQFTAQRDLSDVHRPDLPDAPQVLVALDPRGLAAPAIGSSAD